MEIPHTHVIMREPTPAKPEVIGVFRTFVPEYAQNRVEPIEDEDEPEAKVVKRPRGRRPKATEGAETK